MDLGLSSSTNIWLIANQVIEFVSLDNLTLPGHTFMNIYHTVFYFYKISYLKKIKMFESQLKQIFKYILNNLQKEKRETKMTLLTNIFF